jgi:hypothetical protein
VSEPGALLYSLSEFSSLILPCLEAAGARRILEIGSEAGTFTRELCAWAERHGGAVTCIEPSPQIEHERLAERYGLEVVAGRSPAAFDGLGEFDAYISDSDHNHWVVSHELRHAFSGSGSPLVIVHDVGWPCARRDQYYDPDAVPPEHRQPYSYEDGVVLDNPGLVRRGFRGEGAFAFAEREGGPGNGVLTAVEDLLAERPEMDYLQVPCVFGLGFLFHREAPWAADVHRIVGPFHDNELLARLERNRLSMFLRLIRGPRGPEPVEPAATAFIASLLRDVGALQAECANLRLEAAGQRSAK